MKSIILSIIILASSVILYVIFISNIETQARKQNQLNLTSVKHCISQYNPKMDLLSENLSMCAEKQRSLGVTGDMFVIRASDKKLFWDSSVDCRPENGLKLFMNKEGVCPLFRDPISCTVAVDQMLNKTKQNITWKFDNDIEWVNYIYLETDLETYILAQGTQKDEALESFYPSLAFFAITAGLFIIVSAI